MLSVKTRNLAILNELFYTLASIRVQRVTNYELMQKSACICM